MKQSTRQDIVTAALFVLWGPVIGVVATGAIRGGFWGAIAAPIAAAFMVTLFREAALLALMLLSLVPALVSAGCVILVRRLNRHALLIPAAMAGACIGVLCIATFTRTSIDADLLLVASIAAFACCLIDIFLQKLLRRPLKRGGDFPNTVRPN